MKNFFGSFTKTTGGYSRPDQNSDLGGQYRSVIGIPGGTKGALYPLVTKYAPEVCFHPLDYTDPTGNNPKGRSHRKSR